jgi:futalosine hydrolase
VKILLIAATSAEILPFVTNFKVPLNKEFSIGHIQVLTIVSGAGMVATAYSLGNALRNFQPDFILNVGIAGAIDRSIELGTLVNVVQDYLHRFGAEDNDQFISASKIGILNPDVEYLQSSLLKIERNELLKSIDLLKKVNGITVQTVHGNASSIKKLKLQHPEAQIESMEGAAVFYAGFMEQIPVIQLRSISNFVEPRNRASWKIPEAIKVLNDFLINQFTKA